MSIVEGKIRPLNKNILVSDMNFDEQVTASGIVILSDDGKTHGVKPRWCQVWAIGPEQHDVKVGDWVLVEHGRWTRSVTVKEGNNEVVIRRVDPDAVMLISDNRPSDVYIGEEIGTSPTQTVKPEDFV